MFRRYSAYNDLGKFKMVLNLPGASSASYSRSLQFQLPSGAAVLKLENPYHEFYYASMVDGVHYVAVNVSTVGTAWAALRADDTRAKALGEAARNFAATSLSGPALVGYWDELFAVHAALQTFTPGLPPRPCMCPFKRQPTTGPFAYDPDLLREVPKCKKICPS